MTEQHKCPECGKPMSLVRVLPPIDDDPPLGAFYCSPCQFADTVPILPEHQAPALVPF